MKIKNCYHCYKSRINWNTGLATCLDKENYGKQIDPHDTCTNWDGRELPDGEQGPAGIGDGDY